MTSACNRVLTSLEAAIELEAIWLQRNNRETERIMASRRVTAQEVVGMLFELSSDHDYETDSASEAEEEERF
ncbi:hypothetical protein NDU88_001384 [Pleurodeles waltl]|uniref:Uncharacterized protein n=1 Tax=Pleurodeles waltl TaxID=8319 RepID=A0AAV7MPS0_PLEWA|nr:hypothetical protein NDU88_001384 [Pleurodeles waltl]